MQSKSEDINLKGVVAQQKSRDASRVQAAHPEFINYQRALAKQESRDTARAQAAHDEAGLNGRAIAWHYWVHLMPVLNAMQAACLMSALEPDVFANLNERPGKTDPAKCIDKAKKIQRLAEAQGKLTSSPVEWVEWAQSQTVKVHLGFLLAVEELPKPTGESSAPAAKVESVTVKNPSSDEIPGKIPNTTNGQLAIKAAWKIECGTGKRATAKQVIETLQSWVDHKDNPDAVAELTDKIPNGVKWVTSAGKENNYDIGACQKTLETWNKSRA